MILRFATIFSHILMVPFFLAPEAGVYPGGQRGPVPRPAEHVDAKCPVVQRDAVQRIQRHRPTLRPSGNHRRDIHLLPTHR